MIKFEAKKSLSNLSSKLTAFVKSFEKDSENKMNKAVNLVYKTARKKRADITYVSILGGTETIKGRVPKEIKEAFHTRTVSDPNAEFGVPVRTGNLRDSIKKEVKQLKTRLIGRVYVDQNDAPYAKYVEFGTSKMQARPFMRPAYDNNIEEIKKIFHDKNA